MTNSKPRVSIILPVYNGADTLNRCLQSVEEQSFTNWELILIDDGSTDRTSQILDGLVENSKIKLIRFNKNLGFVKALQAGIAKATGEYIARIDADDAWHPSHLEVLTRLALRRTDGVLFSSQAYHCQRLDGVRIVVGRSAQIEEAKIRQMLVKDNPIVHSSVLIDKAAYFQVGGFLTAYRWEDYYLWIRLLREGKFYFSGTPTVDYYLVENSFSREKREYSLAQRFELQLLAFVSLKGSRTIRSTLFLGLSAARLAYLNFTSFWR